MFSQSEPGRKSTDIGFEAEEYAPFVRVGCTQQELLEITFMRAATLRLLQPTEMPQWLQERGVESAVRCPPSAIF